MGRRMRKVLSVAALLIVSGCSTYMPQRYGISAENNFSIWAPTVLTPPAPTFPAVIGAPVARPAPALPARLASLPATPVQFGKFIYQAEHVPQVRACDGQGNVTFTGTGGGVELYEARCANGDVLTVRCEWGNCRALR